jgi:hypothetical protein
MAWDAKHTLLASLAAAAIAGGGIAFHSWLAAHDALLRAQSTVAQQQTAIDREQKASARIAAQETERDAAAAKRIAALRAQAARAKTPAQIAAWLPKRIPAPQPIEIQIPPPTKQNPAPAAIATIPQPDLGSLRDYVSACQTCNVQLHAAQEDLAAKNQQLQLASRQLSAALKQRDAALQAAKGGSFWHRAAAAVKWFAIGAGAGAALLCASGHCH